MAKYQSQFVPTNFGLATNILGMLRQDMQQRDQAFEQAQTTAANTLGALGSIPTADIEGRQQRLDAVSTAMEEAVNRRGGDWAAASGDLMKIIAAEKANPWYQFNAQQLEKSKEFSNYRNQLGLNFHSEQDPTQVTYEEYLQNPNALDFSVINKEDLRKKVREYGKNRSELYTEQVNREVAQGVREIGEYKGYRTPELQAEFMETEGLQAISDIMNAYGVTDPGIGAELEQELLSSIKGEKKTQYIYPRTATTGTSGRSSKSKADEAVNLRSHQKIDNITGTLPVNHPFFNLQSKSQGAIASGKTGKNSPYINKKLSGAYIPTGTTYQIGADEEVKGGKRGEPVKVSFGPGEATYTGPKTIYRVKSVEEGTPLTEELNKRLEYAVMLGKDSRATIPGVDPRDKPHGEDENGEFYIADKGGSKETKVYVEETPVLTFNSVQDGEAFTVFEDISGDRNRVLGDFGPGILPDLLQTSYQKKGDSYEVDNIKFLDDPERVDRVTRELIKIATDLSSVDNPQAEAKVNQIMGGLDLIRSIATDLNSGVKPKLSKKEKNLLDAIQNDFANLEEDLFSHQFKISDNLTPDIQ